jgi:signal transduction histidine kinase
MLSIFSVVIWFPIYIDTRPQVTYLMVFSIALLRFCFFTFVSVVVARLNHLQHNLEALAETRAQALAREVAERERLEREMLEISEREQRRIGQDLHDGLCQLLTGTALTGHAHARSLATQGNVAEAEKARKIVNFIEEAISLARSIAKGLDPIELQSGGLMQALEDFTFTTSELCGIQCQFGCHVPVLIHSPNTAVHLYRIAQEAVGNAVKHGRATAIDVLLEETDVGVQLSVIDNGEGLPEPFPRNGGMGLRTMTVRAKLAGGHFAIRRLERGAEVTCVVPEAANA